MKIWLKRAASAAFLLFAVPVSGVHAQVATTPKTVSSTAYGDLGAGPLQIQSGSQSFTYQLSDTQPVASSTGFYSDGQSPIPVQTTSHVWAKALQSTGSTIIVAPISLTGAGSVGTDYSVNGGTFPVVGADFPSTGGVSHYVLAKSFFMAGKSEVRIQLRAGYFALIVLDDGTAAVGAAPINATAFTLNNPGETWASQTFKGRVSIYELSYQTTSFQFQMAVSVE